MSIFLFSVSSSFFIIFPRGFISLRSQISLRRRRRVIPSVAATTRLVIYVFIYSLLIELAEQGANLELPYSLVAKTCLFAAETKKRMNYLGQKNPYELFGTKKTYELFRPTLYL